MRARRAYGSATAFLLSSTTATALISVEAAENKSGHIDENTRAIFGRSYKRGHLSTWRLNLQHTAMRIDDNSNDVENTSEFDPSDRGFLTFSTQSPEFN